MNVPPRNDAIPVSTASMELLQDAVGRGGRKIFVFRNNSPNAVDIITLSFGSRAAVAGSGVILRQNDQYGEADGDGFECWQGPIQAICATINGSISVMERERD